MIQKALKVGSSVAVTIPKKSLIVLGIKAGDDINVHVDERRRRMTLEPMSAVSVDRDLVDWADGFIEQYRPALDALKDK